MTPDQVVLDKKPIVAQRGESTRAEPRPRERRKWGWVAAIAILVAVLGAGGAFMAWGQRHSEGSKQREHADRNTGSSSRELKVQVVKPERGGMERSTSQPGTIRAFEYANLYAKVSGFIKTLNVDRGSPVKKGELLAEIYDPERIVAVDQAQAGLEHAKSVVAQARANILTAQAALLAAVAKKKEAIAILEQRKPARDYRRKEYERISELVAKKDVEERLKDEDYDEYLAAEGAVHSAEAGIETAESQIADAKAKLELARADLKVAEAGIHVSEANLELAKVFVQYTKILSPYDGVVTFRGDSVHPGSFVRSAAEGVGEPLLTVAENDKMRTIVLVPDRDVPYCKVGDPATVTLDALAGKVLKGAVNRIAESEDLKDRTMRVEIDLPNPDHALRDGMFGRASILLEKLIKSLSIPSSCLIERNGKGDGAVLVVRDGEVHRANIHVGIDNGLRVEVASGLSEDDLVIAQPDASIAEGTKVQVEILKGTPATGSVAKSA